jgi:L,D-transpeptidase-like protein
VTRRVHALAAIAVVVALVFFLFAPDNEELGPPATAFPIAEPIDWTKHSLLVSPRLAVAVHDRPDGRVVSLVRGRTPFGSRELLSPAGGRRGSWVAVRHTSLGNSRIGWVDLRGSGLELAPRPLRLEVDLSRRELVVAGEGQLTRMSVAIGAPETPTPPGTYYVTDKLPGIRYGEFYGCCILALSGRQPNLPRGWSGGDRLAIHGSPIPTWGKNVSNGCLHAREGDLRWLLKQVPLGTTVTIRA